MKKCADVKTPLVLQMHLVYCMFPMKYTPSPAALKLKEIRKRRGLTQRDIHNLTKESFPPDGVSLSAIRQIECGMKRGTHVMTKIAVALGVSANDLNPKQKRTRPPSAA